MRHHRMYFVCMILISALIVGCSTKEPGDSTEDSIAASAPEAVNKDVAERDKYGLVAGEAAPDFSVVADSGEEFVMSEALEKGPVVLVFYRGGWCPYCQLQLRELQQNVSEFERRGATLVALSVDTPENAGKSKGEMELGFPVLSDPDAKTLELYRLTLHLDDEILEKYKGYNIDVEAASGRDHHIIAVPAVYVIDGKGVIRWAFVNEDYKVRAKLEEIFAAIDSL